MFSAHLPFLPAGLCGRLDDKEYPVKSLREISLRGDDSPRELVGNGGDHRQRCVTYVSTLSSHSEKGSSVNGTALISHSMIKKRDT